MEHISKVNIFHLIEEYNQIVERNKMIVERFSAKENYLDAERIIGQIETLEKVIADLKLLL